MFRLEMRTLEQLNDHLQIAEHLFWGGTAGCPFSEFRDRKQSWASARWAPLNGELWNAPATKPQDCQPLRGSCGPLRKGPVSVSDKASRCCLVADCWTLSL